MGFIFRISYLERQNLKRGIPNSRDASPRIQSYADFGKDIYLKRPASNAKDGYVPPIWMGFWVQNYLNKGPVPGKSSLDMDGLSRNWQKKSKWVVFIIKVGLTATVGN